MALAFYFAPPSGMTAQQYDECTRRLDQAGVGRPKDRLYHACFGTPDSVSVFDVWTSQAAFDVFGQTLMPILQDMGIDVGQPAVMPVHNTIVPAAPKPKVAAAKPAAKKAAPKKPAAKKPAAKKATRGKQAPKRAAAARRVAPKKKASRRAGKKR